MPVARTTRDAGTVGNMTIKVRFFASLAESVGRREADLAFQDGLTAATVWRQFNRGSELPDGVLCAVNHSYCDVQASLADNDEVAYFPPVTGG